MQESIEPELGRKPCETCGKMFTLVKANQKYCEPGHRPRARTIKISPEQRLAILAIAHQLR